MLAIREHGATTAATSKTAERTRCQNGSILRSTRSVPIGLHASNPAVMDYLRLVRIRALLPKDFVKRTQTAHVALLESSKRIQCSIAPPPVSSKRTQESSHSPLESSKRTQRCAKFVGGMDFRARSTWRAPTETKRANEPNVNLYGLRDMK